MHGHVFVQLHGEAAFKELFVMDAGGAEAGFMAKTGPAAIEFSGFSGRFLKSDRGSNQVHDRGADEVR